MTLVLLLLIDLIVIGNYYWQFIDPIERTYWTDESDNNVTIIDPMDIDGLMTGRQLVDNDQPNCEPVDEPS